ncbi:MAG: outer membrane protein [Dolichospermum sp.]
MNKHKCFLGLAILATLVTTPAQAESVSRKAADLMAQNSNPTDSVDQNTNNTQPVNTLASVYEGSDTDSKLPASNYWYVSGSVGLAFPRDVNATGSGVSGDLSLDSGFQLTAAGGYQRKDTRAEVEVSFRSPGADKLTVSGNEANLTGNVNQTTFLVNGYYDIPTKSKLRPYVGAGIGFGLISPDIKFAGNKVETSNGTSFAYQGKIGVEYEVVKKGNAFVEFKYLGLSGYTSKKNGTETEFGSFNSPALSVGYRQGF